MMWMPHEEILKPFLYLVKYLHLLLAIGKDLVPHFHDVHVKETLYKEFLSIFSHVVIDSLGREVNHCLAKPLGEKEITKF